MAITGVRKDNAIADIGCGNGQLLYEMQAAGFRHLRGYDPYLEQEKKLGPNFWLERKSIFEVEEKYDLLMMHHSFEHMPQPDKVLTKANDLLHQGGKMLIRVPVADAEIWKNEGAHWVQLDAPRHLNIPSVKRLCQLAETSGFKTQKVVFDSTAFQFWGTALYKVDKPLHGIDRKQDFSETTLAQFEKNAHELNRLDKGDQACFYFKKASSDFEWPPSVPGLKPTSKNHYFLNGFAYFSSRQSLSNIWKTNLSKSNKTLLGSKTFRKTAGSLKSSYRVLFWRFCSSFLPDFLSFRLF